MKMPKAHDEPTVFRVESLLREVSRILVPDGLLAVMHWNYDEKTPRGPSMATRPRPEDCHKWVSQCDFMEISPTIALPPWHYGFSARSRRRR